jgi:cation transport ATPase
MMIGACYCAYAREDGRSATGSLRDLFLLSIIFVIPSLIGAASGFYLAYNTSYFYALGTGTSIYAAVRLAGPLFDNTQQSSSKESIKMALLIALGLLLIYFAALFHSG